MKLESGSTTVTAGLIHDHLQAFLFLERDGYSFFLKPQNRGQNWSIRAKIRLLSPGQGWDLSAAFPTRVFQSPLSHTLAFISTEVCSWGSWSETAVVKSVGVVTPIVLYGTAHK